MQRLHRRQVRHALDWLCSIVKVPPWQWPSSAPAPSQGAPGGAGQLYFLRGGAEPLDTQSLPRGWRQPPPKSSILPRLTTQAPRPRSSPPPSPSCARASPRHATCRGRPRPSCVPPAPWRRRWRMTGLATTELYSYRMHIMLRVWSQSQESCSNALHTPRFPTVLRRSCIPQRGTSYSIQTTSPSR